MSQISPTNLYELYKEKRINKSEFINRVITIYELSDSEKIRLECLKVIALVEITSEKIFKFLEEVIISDPDIELRLHATSLALKNFPNNGYNLVNYLFNSTEPKEFIIRVAKIIGEGMVASDNNITIELSNSLKSLILKIFENEDVRSFEILWGDWFHKIHEGFWEFLLEIKNPIGLLEIMDYFISNYEIYEWFYNSLITQFSFEQWITLLNNSRFSGRLLYIISFLEEEKPSNRFYQTIDLFTQFGTNLTQIHVKHIKDLIKKYNQYNLALVLIFHWIDNFNIASLKEIFEDPDLKLFLKITEVVMNTKFGFFKHEYFLFSVISLLLKVSEEISENYSLLFFQNIPLGLKKHMISKLLNIIRAKQSYENSERNKFYSTKFEVADKFLGILSRQYDINSFAS